MWTVDGLNCYGGLQEGCSRKFGVTKIDMFDVLCGPASPPRTLNKWNNFASLLTHQNHHNDYPVRTSIATSASTYHG
jgi:hypothetical protein